MGVPTAVWMASRHISRTSLPKPLLKAAHEVFSSESKAVIRDYGSKVAQALTEIHGMERPRDISSFKPFITSEEALNDEVTAQHVRPNYSARMKHVLDLPSSAFEGKVSEANTEAQKPPSLKYMEPHALGYTYKRMPPTYGAAVRALSEAKYRLPLFTPKSVLDYGSGTGSGGWAALSLYPELDRIVGVEPSPHMRTMGKKLSRYSPQFSWCESIANLPSAVSAEGLFDIVMCNYVLSENSDPKVCTLILEALWQRTKSILLIIEPGTPKGFRFIHSAREWVLGTLPRTQANILAPCPHEGNCPLAKDDKSYCHFSQFTGRYPKDVFPNMPGAKDIDNEKFSYLLVMRGESPRQKGNSPDEFESVADKSFFWDRLVRPTMRRDKHIIMDRCLHSQHSKGKDDWGRLERTIVTKSEDKEIYKTARNAGWGDLWPHNS
jgi:ribosomal protein RSM22 (predicted rRNA methylase)